MPINGLRIETEIVLVEEGRLALEGKPGLLSAQEIGEQRNRADAAQRLAARIAAKRAVAKILGLGSEFNQWQDIRIVNEKSGRPTIILPDHLHLQNDSRSQLMLSLSHCPTHAVALVTSCD